MKFRFFILLSIVVAVAAAVPGQSNYAFGFRAPVGAGTAAVSGTNGSLTPAVLRSLEREAFELINAERSRAGLSHLTWNDKVAEVARVHSDSMAELNFFSHRGLDGSMVSDRAAKLNMGHWSAIGENIAFMKGYENPVKTAVEKWLLSPGHKRNLLNPDWTDAAIGLAVTGDGKYYFTQVFIRN